MTPFDSLRSRLDQLTARRQALEEATETGREANRDKDRQPETQTHTHAYTGTDRHAPVVSSQDQLNHSMSRDE